MNRHLTDYAALPTDALGPPMRAEPEKPADGPWKPLRPGYVSRVLAGGAVEVKRTDLPVQPPKQEWQEPAESIITPLAPSSAAPIEWQSEVLPTAEQAKAAWMDLRLSFADGWAVKAEFGLKDASTGEHRDTTELDPSRRAAFIARCHELYKPESTQ
jgi:hypothetical protein